jgi:GTP-binding protein LepA
MKSIALEQIRNFCIIAHIDHGKSTLADRLIEMTATVSRRDMREQLLDTLDLEREHGITIKSTAIRMDYEASDGRTYQFNLIDTPGHVDFSYEVSRALAACEGAVLLVDASQGIEAQTVAHIYKALEFDLELIPVVNKVDMPSARTQAVKMEIAEVLGVAESDILEISAKTGAGVGAVAEAVIRRLPAPIGDRDASLRALVFDSSYDQHRGVMAYVRLIDGCLQKGEGIHLPGSKRDAEVFEVGIFTPAFQPVECLAAGEVGYVGTGLKDVHDCPVGDTLLRRGDSNTPSLPGYTPANPMVFAGVYPEQPQHFPALRKGLETLRLNDSALTFEPEDSGALGFGFRVGFLGLLHMAIVRERLEREHNLELVMTNPSVEYEITMRDGAVAMIGRPSELPDPSHVEVIKEPWANLNVVAPTEYIGSIIELVRQIRGEIGEMEYMEPTRVLLNYKVPLAGLLIDFFDRLKSATRGFASMDYELIEYRAADVVRLDVLVNGDRVDALSIITDRETGKVNARDMVTRLRKIIPRQLFPVALQGAINSRIVARETVPALRKDVLAKCYGGDVTRKRKLLAKQKAGKERMKRVGQVDIPQEAFSSLLDRSS